MSDTDVVTVTDSTAVAASDSQVTVGEVVKSASVSETAKPISFDGLIKAAAEYDRLYAARMKRLNLLFDLVTGAI